MYQIINYFDNNKIIGALKSGGLVILPSDTVYAACIDPTNNNAVNKLNVYKQRMFGKPYPILVSNIKMAKKYAELNKTAVNLYNNFLPGPITVVSKSKEGLAPGISSENKTLAIRIPNYPNLLNLITKFKKPIVATSANIDYQKRPYKISDILTNISGKQKAMIDLIVDLGTLPKNDLSSVVDTTLDDEPVTLRQGGIKLKTNKNLSRSVEDTFKIANKIWNKYKSYINQRPIIFAIKGQMGVGKTHFVKGLVKASGINDNVTSPSYDLINTYANKKIQIVHIDTWRMADADQEINDVGIKSYLNKGSVVCIEWADKLTNEARNISDDAIVIKIDMKYTKSEARQIVWEVK